MANLTITSEISEKILGKKALVDAAKDWTCRHRVGTKRMYYLDENGAEKLDQPYYIVNLDLINERQVKKALELYNQGEFQKASNQGLTVQVTPEMATELNAALSCVVTVEEVMNKDGEVMFGVRANQVRPVKAEKGQKLDFKALLNQASKAVIEQAVPETATI